MSYQHPPDQYSIIPTRTPARTLGLARVLLTVAATTPPASVAKRLSRIHTKAVALQSAWIEVNRPEEPTDTRPYDNRIDRNWRVCHDRIEHWVKIDHPDKAQEAAELHELLFPTGLDFTRLPYDEEWAESERRIALIEHDELGSLLADLIDQRFVDSLHTAHAEYGKALGITEAQDEPDTAVTGVGEALGALRKEMSAYARLLMGLADPDDDEAIAAVEAHLAPIIRYRKSRTGADEAEEPEEPVDAPVPQPPLAGEAAQAAEAD